MVIKFLPVFLFAIISLTAYGQKDSVQIYYPDDLLPAEPSEGMSYDYLEENNNIYAIQLRSRYISNPELSPKIYNRIKSSYGNYSIGLITEKDAGEKNLTDFYSYYFSYHGEGIIKQFIAGNYNLTFGSGLAASNSYRSVKTSDPFFPLNNSGFALKPYGSTDENKYFRGAALAMEYDVFTITAFYSDNRFDAGIDSTGLINSIPVSGTHITSGELLRKDAASIKSAGLITEYNSSIFNAALLYMNNSFGNEISPLLPYKRKNNFISLYANIPINETFVLTGESAANFSNMNNILTGDLLLSENVHAIASYRNYKSGFADYYGNAFGESYNSGYNETGIFSGLRIKFSPVVFDLYYDQFRLNNSLSSFSGDELLLNCKYKAGRATYFKLKYRTRIKENSLSPVINRNNLSLQFTTLLNKAINEDVKIEYVKSYKSGDDGFMFYNDIGYYIEETFKVNFRVTMFHTTSYESALYEYEKDLPGLFTSKILSGSGIRYYLMGLYKPVEHITLSVKYSSVKRNETAVNNLEMQGEVNF